MNDGQTHPSGGVTGPNIPPRPSQPRSRLAGQGLVLILMGVVPGIGIMFAIAGIVLCVIELHGSHRAGRVPMPASIGLGLSPFTMIGGIVIMLACFGPGPNSPAFAPEFPFLTEPGDRIPSRVPSRNERELTGTEHGIECMANLGNIHAAIVQFELDNGRSLRALSELYPQYLPDPAVFVCPGSDDIVEKPDQIDTGSYAYTPPKDGAAPAATVIVSDRESANHGGIRYGVHLDGSVKKIAKR